jgi:hypothetical protein
MAPNAGNRRISPSHRQVLRLLANVPHGRAELKLIARFSIEIFELIAAGLVEVRAETMRESGQTIETVSVRITAAGRKALEG